MCAESSPIGPELRSPARTETPERAVPESARKRPNRAERSDRARRRVGGVNGRARAAGTAEDRRAGGASRWRCRAEVSGVAIATRQRHDSPFRGTGGGCFPPC